MVCSPGEGDISSERRCSEGGFLNWQQQRVIGGDRGAELSAGERDQISPLPIIPDTMRRRINAQSGERVHLWQVEMKVKLACAWREERNGLNVRSRAYDLSQGAAERIAGQ